MIYIKKNKKSGINRSKNYCKKYYVYLFLYLIITIVDTNY